MSDPLTMLDVGSIECDGTQTGPVIVIVPTVPRVDHDDVADQYAIEVRPDTPGGLIVYSEYRGKWSANPWSTRALVWSLLAEVHRLQARTSALLRVVGAARAVIAYTSPRNTRPEIVALRSALRDLVSLEKP